MRIAGKGDIIGFGSGTLERVRRYYLEGRRRRERQWEEEEMEGGGVYGERVEPMQEGKADFFFDPVRWKWRIWYVGIDGRGAFLD
jgi:hypothetical protein